MDIPDVKFCIQLGVTQFLTLADIWQRLGRAARADGLEGDILIFAQKSFLLPDPSEEYYKRSRESGPIDWNLAPAPMSSDEPMPNFYLPVVPNETSTEALENVKRINNMFHDPKNKNRSLEPALLWLLTTTGCRQRIPMMMFEDPRALDDDVWPIEAPCLCDNCSFPMREYYDRLEPPHEIKRSVMAPPNLPPRHEHGTVLSATALKEMRSASITFYRDIALAKSGNISLLKSIRYMDSAAYENDLYTSRLRQFQNSTTTGHSRHVPARLVTRIFNTLTELTKTIYIRDGIKSVFRLKYMDFFPEDLARRIARGKAAGKAASTIQDFGPLFGGKFDLESSTYRKYIKEIADVCDEEMRRYHTEEADRKKRLQEERAAQMAAKRQAAADQRKVAAEARKAAKLAEKARAAEAKKRATLETQEQDVSYTSDSSSNHPSGVSDTTHIPWSETEQEESDKGNESDTLSWSASEREPNQSDSDRSVGSNVSNAPKRNRTGTPMSGSRNDPGRAPPTMQTRFRLGPSPSPSPSRTPDPSLIALGCHSNDIPPSRNLIGRARDITPIPSIGKKRKLGGHEMLMDLRTPDAPLLGQEELDIARQQAREASILSDLEGQIAG